MAYDFATNPATGDWIFSGNRDIQGIEGEQVVAQRIRHRLRIVRRAWPLDPSNGVLGSRLEESVRLPRSRVLRELRLMVEEALAPMSDEIEITGFEVHEEGLASIKMTIEYQVLSLGESLVPIDARLGETLTYELPT